MGYDRLALFEALKNKEDITLLALESSCDETAAAIVKNGRQVLSGCIASQIELHRKYGGVVPEIASREHVRAINALIDEALAQANIGLEGIDGIAVTCGPGLVGALLVAVSTAKALAFALNKPLVAVNHIEGHICANFIQYPELTPPFVCLIASGGHSHIVCVEDYCKYRILGATRDDAAGEVLDKIARVLALPYPGGPALEKLAIKGNETALARPGHFLSGEHYDFSFSGLKTHMINQIMKSKKSGEVPPEDAAASFQYWVMSALVSKTVQAAKDMGVHKIALCGGVAANKRLRQELFSRADGREVYIPDAALCTDNAAMIGSAGYYRLLAGETADMQLNAIPSQEL
ncbi:MAG: tRNA (adenosine(37)-N6)-threonylcarbamoyltransferase complex transferase subunit TsaD [Christensenellales bacterium]